jgi:hypothetical protein
MQSADLTTLREGVIPFALATNTLPFKIATKNRYHVHKAIAVYMLESMWSDPPSDDTPCSF